MRVRDVASERFEYYLHRCILDKPHVPCLKPSPSNDGNCAIHMLPQPSPETQVRFAEVPALIYATYQEWDVYRAKDVSHTLRSEKLCTRSAIAHWIAKAQHKMCIFSDHLSSQGRHGLDFGLVLLVRPLRPVWWVESEQHFYCVPCEP